MPQAVCGRHFKACREVIWILSTLQVCNTETNVLLEHACCIVPSRLIIVVLTRASTSTGLRVNKELKRDLKEKTADIMLYELKYFVSVYTG